MASPRYLCNILENVYCGRYSSGEEVAADMRLMFSNARAYYGEDAEFGTSKYCKATEASFEKEWSTWSSDAARTRPEEYIPRCPLPAGMAAAAGGAGGSGSGGVGGPTGVGAGAGRGSAPAQGAAHVAAPAPSSSSSSSRAGGGAAGPTGSTGTGGPAASRTAAGGTAPTGQVNQQLEVLVQYMNHIQSGGDISALPLRPQKFHDWAAALQPQIQQLLQMQAQLKGGAEGGAGAAAEAAGQAESAGQESATA